MFFTLMVTLFFLLIVVILLITLLNFLGWTHIDLDEYAGQQLNNRNGLTPKELSRLEQSDYTDQRLVAPDQPHAPHNAESNRDNPNDISEIVCSICYSPFETGVKVIYLPNCNHLYHTECILDWFKSHGTCPNCRQDVKQLLKQEEEDTNNLLNKSIFEISDI